MFGINKEQVGENGVIISLVGDVSVTNAEQIKQVLLDTLNQYQQIQINCEQMTNIDIFAIQMLCSAHRTAVAWNKLLTWNGELPPLLTDTIKEAGFARRNGCSQCPDGEFCMWSCKQVPAAG